MESRLDVVSLMAVIRLAAVAVLAIGAFVASHEPASSDPVSMAAAGPALMIRADAGGLTDEVVKAAVAGSAARH